MKGSRVFIPLLAATATAVAAWLLWRPAPPPAPKPPVATGATPVPPPELSALARPPVWEELEPWQGVITRREFLQRIENVFTVSPAWRNWFHVGDHDVLVETGVPDQRFRLRFATDQTDPPNPRHWRRPGDLAPAPPERPLEGVRIAIDPGHIGGEWAKLEERWFQLDGGTPIKEGDMTLLVANLLRPKLEDLGAIVTLVRESTDPVTDLRPETLAADLENADEASISELAERLFYRTAEIRARARLVNEVIEPDLVLCLHFNAEAWGDPTRPSLVERHHLHLLVNGAYMDSEIALPDQRYEMLRKIVQQTHAEEAALGNAIASTFAEMSGLPPYLYEPNSSRAINIGGNPYLWARNLLANRLYDCPVVFLEPYVMNSTLDYPRLQAGDFEGLREVDGRLRPSIFREYADAVASGLARHYQSFRPTGL